MTLPSSGSKNPVIGVIRCPFCPEVATVHVANRRGKHKYTICPSCGTDQKTGKVFQDYINKNMVDDVNSLPEVAPPIKPNEPKQAEVKPNLPTEVEPKQAEVKPNLPTEVEPKQTEVKPNLPTEVEPNQKPIIFAGVAVFLLVLSGLIAFFKKGAANCGNSNKHNL